MTETPLSPLPRRDFDWGPPAGPIPEHGAEWGVYLLFVILIAGGGWLLIDSARHGDFASPPETITAGVEVANRKKGTGADRSEKVNTSGLPQPLSEQAGTEQPVVAVAPRKTPTFQVQLGAFSDEEMAKATFAQIQEKGFSATFLPPDDQFEMYRITLGPFTTESEANLIARELNELDFPCFVIESP